MRTTTDQSWVPYLIDRLRGMTEAEVRDCYYVCDLEQKVIRETRPDVMNCTPEDFFTEVGGETKYITVSELLWNFNITAAKGMPELRKLKIPMFLSESGVSNKDLLIRKQDIPTVWFALIGVSRMDQVYREHEARKR